MNEWEIIKWIQFNVDDILNTKKVYVLEISSINWYLIQWAQLLM